MGVRLRRGVTAVEGSPLRELADLAFPGRGGIGVNARVRRLTDIGERLGMTTGDTVLLATETLRALDLHGELQPAIDDVFRQFDAGRLLTKVREPMNRYLDRTVVSALAVAVCEQCRPGIPVRAPVPENSKVRPVDTVDDAPKVVREARRQTDQDSMFLQQAADWPEYTLDGFPQITLNVLVWWPGLAEWEPATLTARVSQSLAFTGETFTLLIEQPGDPGPARTNAAWLLRRPDLGDGIPLFELRASTWEMVDDEAHEYRFLVASSSPWCSELHDFLAARWATRGRSPRGPEAFDAVAFGDAAPPLRSLAPG